jgi:hypothetical protein
MNVDDRCSETQEKAEALGRIGICSIATLSTTNPTLTVRGSNPSLRGKMHGMAYSEARVSYIAKWKFVPSSEQYSLQGQMFYTVKVDNVKLPLYTLRMCIGRVEIRICSFLTSALDGDDGFT